jgi:hypothetical protein
MLTSIADNQFAIIGYARLLKLRALALVILPTSTGLWTEALNGTQLWNFLSGCMSLFSRRLAGQGLLWPSTMSI